MWRSAEHKEIDLFVHLDSFLLSVKQMCTLRVQNENGIHLKLQNSKSWMALLWEKYVEMVEKTTRLYLLKTKGGKKVGRVLDEKCYPSPIPKGGLAILLMVQFKTADEKRKCMERLKEIITKNYTSDFPLGIEIENQEEYIKTI